MKQGEKWKLAEMKTVEKKGGRQDKVVHRDVQNLLSQVPGSFAVFSSCSTHNLTTKNRSERHHI